MHVATCFYFFSVCKGKPFPWKNQQTDKIFITKCRICNFIPFSYLLTKALAQHQPHTFSEYFRRTGSTQCMENRVHDDHDPFTKTNKNLIVMQGVKFWMLLMPSSSIVNLYRNKKKEVPTKLGITNKTVNQNQYTTVHAWNLILPPDKPSFAA